MKTAAAAPVQRPLTTLFPYENSLKREYGMYKREHGMYKREYGLNKWEYGMYKWEYGLYKWEYGMYGQNREGKDDNSLTKLRGDERSRKSLRELR